MPGKNAHRIPLADFELRSKVILWERDEFAFARVAKILDEEARMPGLSRRGRVGLRALAAQSRRLSGGAA